MRISKKATSVIAVAATAALTLTACGGGGTGANSDVADTGATAGEATDENKPDELTVAAWMDFPQDLLDSFEEKYGIKVVVNSFPNGEAAQTVLRNGLAADGAGLSDVHLIGGDWVPEMFSHPQDFVTLPEIPGRWVDWVVPLAMVGDDVLGYPTDIGPQAIAFDSGLIADAGLPSDPEDFGEFYGGENATWESYFDAGRKFIANSDAAWVDSMFFPLLGAISQMPAPFENPETGNAIPVEENTELHDTFMLFANAAEEGLSAGIPIGHADWGAGFQAREWATVVTPAWKASIIAENAAGVDTWRLSGMFPGGGAAWGGSFFTVPSAGPNTAWAVKLADFLTSPEAAVQWFETNGQFPSQLEAMDSPEVGGVADEFWGGQYVGQIYGDVAKNVPADKKPSFQGPNYAGILSIVLDAVRRVEDNLQTADEAWAQIVTDVNALGLPTD